MIRTIEIECLFDSPRRLSNESLLQLAWLLHGGCVAVSARIIECEERLRPLIYRSSPSRHIGGGIGDMEIGILIFLI